MHKYYQETVLRSAEEGAKPMGREESVVLKKVVQGEEWKLSTSTVQEVRGMSTAPREPETSVSDYSERQPWCFNLPPDPTLDPPGIPTLKMTVYKSQTPRNSLWKRLQLASQESGDLSSLRCVGTNLKDVFSSTDESFSTLWNLCGHLIWLEHSVCTSTID